MRGASGRRSGLLGCIGRAASLHSLRHGYASLLIGKGSTSCSSAASLGHAIPNVTLSMYAHLFAQREHGEFARQAIEASFTATHNAIGL